MHQEVLQTHTHTHTHTQREREREREREERERRERERREREGERDKADNTRPTSEKHKKRIPGRERRSCTSNCGRGLRLPVLVASFVPSARITRGHNAVASRDR